MVNFGGYDLRYNNYHIIDVNNSYNWSYDWKQFPGLSYIPIVSELENKILNSHEFTMIHKWMDDNWHYSLYISIVYLISIPVIKEWIRRRGHPFKLRQPLIVWNSLLSVFSTIGVIRVVPEFRHILVTKGFTASFCQSDYYSDLRLNYWYLWFVWSKVPELVDTLFIVLKGRKVIRLHWVHHVLTLCSTWYAFSDVPASARWLVTMNFLAHSIMYSYYTLKSIGISIPGVISIAITSIQILQMLFGLYVHYMIVVFKRSGILCDCSYGVAVTGLSVYLLFLILFVNFFIKTYLNKRQLKIYLNKII